METIGQENECKKKIKKVKKILANFYEADVYNRSSEAEKVQVTSGVPMHSSDPKVNPNTAENDVPDAVKMLMGYEGCSGSSGVGVGGGDRMNHDLDCTVSDLRLKWICSEMNNETKQFQHMIYPYMMLWVHDESSLHMECGPMLAALKAISWANNENKIGQCCCCCIMSMSYSLN